MTRYQRIATRALALELKHRKEPVTLFAVSCMADRAAHLMGKKNELFSSLHDYGSLLPPGWRQDWLTAGSGSDRVLFCTPPGWKVGSTDSSNLLLGAGRLRRASVVEWGD